MNYRLFVHCCICSLIILCGYQFEQLLAQTKENVFNQAALLPKAETGATPFLEEHPEFDGRGITVAIFDTGVDPGAVGLTETSDGKPKIIDIIDATGSGDISMSAYVEAQDGMLTGHSGRSLKLNKKWKNPTGKYRLGLKAAYDSYPGDLLKRLKAERAKAWKTQQQKREAKLLSELNSTNEEVSKKERQARLDLLRTAIKQYNDPGPVYDCVTFHDGKSWQAVIDTDSDGDLADEKLLTDYRNKHQYATFDDASRLNFSVNIYDDGKLLSLVVVSGEHGTHVAGIVAANFPDRPLRNGLAPGVQIVSVKIGDTRLGGMETGAALIRGLKRVADLNCDLINLSYGEAASIANHGQLVEQFNRIVKEKNVIFVSSAGNSGPALSTVGAPGGSSSEVIGVGAYVSPDMAKVEYSLRKEIDGLPYTWTSRGPTTDGDFGVDIFAPGGAVAPIPNYSLQPNRRMNGTSMAAPNACGNIALMLSGFKQEEIQYTPTSILRSLQATANYLEPVDPLAQGPGLLQVDKAFEHHLHEKTAADFIDLHVSIPSRNNARGFYLRDAVDVSSPVEASVTITPEIDAIKNNDLKLMYEVPILLECSADWVDIGSHLLVTHGGGKFGVLIDASKLKPGLHTTEIIGKHADQQKQGTLFRIPATVTVPENLKGTQFSTKLKSKAGALKRIFLTPPTGSRYAELKLKSTKNSGSSFFYIHNVQLVPGESFEAHESKSTTALNSDEEYSKRFAVVPGHTLEVCIAQYWSSLGESNLELTVEFGGVTSSEDELFLPATGAATALTLTAPLGFTECEVSGSLNHWQRSLSPNRVETNQLPNGRDGLWEEQHIWQSILHYEFEAYSNSRVKLLTPGFTNLIYDLPVLSHRIFLFDENNQLVTAEDMYPSDISLKKGRYTVQLELRHLDPNALKKFAKQPLVIEQTTNRIGLKFYSSRIAAVGDGRSLSKLELTRDESVQLWTRIVPTQSLPSHVQNGDLFTGEVSLFENDPNPLSVRYVVANVPTKKSSTITAKPVTDLKQAEIDFLLLSLKTLNWSEHQEQIEELTQRIEMLTPKNRKLAVARLHLIDTEDRKQRLAEVVKLADRVIQLVPNRRAQSYFGVRHSPESAEEKKLHKEMEAAKADLIDALYRKGRALAYMELPDVVKDKPIENKKRHDQLFENNLKRLSNWVDTTTKDYFLLHIRRDRRKGNYAQAIQLLNKHSGKEQSVYLHHKKRRDLYELLKWKDWQQYEQNWMLRYFPKEQVTF